MMRAVVLGPALIGAAAASAIAQPPEDWKRQGWKTDFDKHTVPFDEIVSGWNRRLRVSVGRMDGGRGLDPRRQRQAHSEVRVRLLVITAFNAASVLTLSACTDNDPAGTPGGSRTPPTQATSCSIPTGQINDGGPGKDGIPALVNPALVINGDPAIDYLQDSDRVIGLAWNGDAIAVPLNVGWWHEIVNLEIGGLVVAVTHCPLTGSSLAFDRGSVDDAAFGVSGLLYQNNLIMYDRNQPESLWPQMSRGARCGPRDGAALSMVPVIEMTWAGWRSLHPNTKIVAGTPGYASYHRNNYPYRVARDDALGDVTRFGLGDPRISVRAGGGLVGLDALPISVRAALKLPGSEFPVDPNEVPISEGQTDIEVAIEAGRRLAGAYPLHLMGWAGYRWRFRDARRDRRPGNETFVRLGTGGPIGPAWSSFRWDLAVEGLWGAGLEQQGLILDSARRRLVQILPTLGWRLGGTELEVTGRLNVSGRNLPSGSAVSAGVVVPWIL